MSRMGTANPAGAEEPGLPRRDLVILPFLSLLTVAVCLLGAEAAARQFFAFDPRDICVAYIEAMRPGHRPNCEARMKTAEGPWVTNRYNNCGYRTEEPCGPTPQGVTRIAVVGGSLTEGLWVEYDQIFAARTARDLTRILGHPVEVQNLGMAGCYPVCVFHQVDDALALKPDLLIWTIDPYDLEHLDPAEMPGRYLPMPYEPTAAPDDSTGLARLKVFIKQSNSAIAAQHFLFQNTSTFLRIYLQYGDKAGYLRPPFSPAWEKRFEAFETLVTEVGQKARAVNVPLVLMDVPSLAQASLLTEHNLPRVDPYAFNQRVKGISSRHGIQFVDGLDAFKGESEVNSLYYVADGHINAKGHALISRALVDQLVREQRDALSGFHKGQHRAAVGQ